jgi:hypothetical protein
MSAMVRQDGYQRVTQAEPELLSRTIRGGTSTSGTSCVAKSLSRFCVASTALTSNSYDNPCELREVAARRGCDIVKVYKDHGISGVQGPGQYILWKIAEAI